MEQQKLKLGDFYFIWDLKGQSRQLIRPISESSANIGVYFVNSESITSITKPIKNKLEFHKSATNEELKQFRKEVNSIYKERYGQMFFGKFENETNNTNITEETKALLLTDDSKNVKKKLKDNIKLLADAKKSLSIRYKKILEDIKISKIPTEKDNLTKQLKEIRKQKKDIREQVKNLKNQYSLL